MNEGSTGGNEEEEMECVWFCVRIYIELEHDMDKKRRKEERKKGMERHAHIIS